MTLRSLPFARAGLAALVSAFALLAPHSGRAAPPPPVTAPPGATAGAVEKADCAMILRGVEERYNGYDSWRVLRYTITDQRGGEKIRRAVIAHKSVGMGRKLRSRLIEPVEMAGVEALVHDAYQGRSEDRVWTWLPGIGEVRAMKSDDMSGRVHGSDLSLGEMMIRRADDYECAFLGEDTHEGLPVWRIWINPLDEAEVIRLGLRDGEIWVDKATFLPVRSAFNADAASEQRLMSASAFRLVDGVFTPTVYDTATRKEGRVISSTRIEVEEERYNIGLPDRWFDAADLGLAESDWMDYAPAR